MSSQHVSPPPTLKSLRHHDLEFGAQAVERGMRPFVRCTKRDLSLWQSLCKQRERSKSPFAFLHDEAYEHAKRIGVGVPENLRHSQALQLLVDQGELPSLDADIDTWLDWRAARNFQLGTPLEPYMQHLQNVVGARGMSDVQKMLKATSPIAIGYGRYHAIITEPCERSLLNTRVGIEHEIVALIRRARVARCEEFRLGLLQTLSPTDDEFNLVITGVRPFRAGDRRQIEEWHSSHKSNATKKPRTQDMQRSDIRKLSPHAIARFRSDLELVSYYIAYPDLPLMEGVDSATVKSLV